MAPAGDPLAPFHSAVRAWFSRAFAAPTPAQALAWPAIARGDSTLVLAPTGSGKTLAAFLACIDRLVFSPEPPRRERLRVIYVSPLKALAVDVERNLRAPLAGIAQVAEGLGEGFRMPGVAVRSGDTPARERARFTRDPADILITTPESLYLLLTSGARETLRTVETVIVDEIHAVVPTKRGAHLALSLERLEALAGRRLQRIGLSATQRPLDEVARFLGGAGPGEGARPSADEPGGVLDELRARGARPAWRPVTVVDAGARKRLEVTVEVPVEDMSRLGEPLDVQGGAASQTPVRASIWTAIHPRLLELVRAHRTTLVFVNSRRVAERLAAALNELAGETLVQAHHGSIARPQRIAIEENLKAGRVRGLVATSSLELGIDMGSVDLVVQIEAPPSVASGMQRIGRAGHQIDAPSTGVIFPKFRADLLACAAIAEAMQEGEVEATRYPRNPLDVLAQQIVAMVSVEDWTVDALLDAVRRAAPFAELPRSVYEGVLDLLAGRYPSDELSDLRPRITWDRVRGVLRAREGAKRVAIVNGGTIPDRGLYGVFLAGGKQGQARVGELDEEMVFESKPGETFLLGASTWRIEEITFDRVLVSPAPGEPGKMPFWKGDAPGRPLELGRRIGKLVRTLRDAPRAAARTRLRERAGLDDRAASNLLRFLDDQAQAAGAVPDEATVLVERCRDELGDWRVCLLAPFGSPVLAPWCMAATARARALLGVEAETLWTNDGFALRIPDAGAPPDPAFLFPEPEEVEALVEAELAHTALFAAKFREAAGRALLLPKRRPGQRAPLWQQRKRAYDLLAVASRFPAFPMLLEAYRECLRDVFDLPALVELLRDVRARRLRTVTADTRTPSPFAASLLFGFVANFIYDGDAPLAERRAQALAIDQAQLRELLGEAELRELLDAGAMADLEARLQHLPPELHVRSADGLADLLLRLGDLSRAEIARRVAAPDPGALAGALLADGRAVTVRIAGEERLVAVEDAGRYRDALGTPLPAGIPEVFLAPVTDPLDGLLARWARRHAPFTAGEIAARFGLARGEAESALERLHRKGRLLEGAFRPGGTEREWCDPEVLGGLRRRSLARLREEVEPVEPRVLGRTLLAWQGVSRRGRGLDAVLDAVERLQGAPLPASLLESEILPARVEGYLPGDLDALAAGGEVLWVGLERLGERDGRVALFLAGALPRLLAPRGAEEASAPTTTRRQRGLPRRAPPADPRPPRRARRVLLRGPARRRGRRLPAGDRGRALGPRLARPRHERHLPGAPVLDRLPRAERREAPGGATGRLPLAALVAARRGRPLDARRRAARRRAGRHADRVERRDRAAAPGALRDRHPRRGRSRGAPGRLRRGLRRAPPPGGVWPDPARLLRRRRGRAPVRAGRRPRPAPRPARAGRGGGGGPARRRRSRQRLGGAPRVAAGPGRAGGEAPRPRGGRAGGARGRGARGLDRARPPPGAGLAPGGRAGAVADRRRGEPGDRGPREGSDGPRRGRPGRRGERVGRRGPPARRLDAPRGVRAGEGRPPAAAPGGAAGVARRSGRCPGVMPSPACRS
jgi:ATP-dependent helicase Lhr and Lhr-like helicase